ncbi:MAG: hypothetical protein ABI681_10430, partial [Gemmatimonadales bacterium]
MKRTEGQHFRTLVAVVTAATFVAWADAGSQQPQSRESLRHEIFADSPAENYLRYLQTTGLVPEYPWSSRAFSQRELRRLIPGDSAHPWRARLADDSREAYGIRYGLIQPTASVRFNSSFAYGSNDGPIWAGRGLTSAVQLGFHAAWGPITLTVAPLAFRAENSSFEILPNSRVGAAAFGDPSFSGVDRPQRFGPSAYTQLDPGQSTLRADFPYVAFGASTANQAWGPGQELPVILGNNAAGFPHI